MSDSQLPDYFKLKFPPEVYGDTTSEPQNSSVPASQSNNIQSEMNSQPYTETSAPTNGRVIEISGDPRYSSNPSTMAPAMQSDFVPQVPYSAPVQQSQQFANALAYTYPVQQQILPPAYSQPVPMSVNVNNSPDKSFFDKSYKVIMDYQVNKIYLLRQRAGNKTKSSNVNVNSAQNPVILNENKGLHNLERTEIADGTITVGSKVIRAAGEFLAVRFTGENGAKTYEELTLDQINDKKFLNNRLLSAGLNFGTSYLKYIIWWLTSQYNNAETVKEPVDGVGEDGRPFYHNADIIRRKAADTLYVRDKINSYIADNANGNLQLFLLALGCASKMPLFLSANQLDIRTVVAFCVNDMGRAIGELSCMYSFNENSRKGLSEFKPEILESNNMVLFFTKGETDYKLKNGLENLSSFIGLNGVIKDTPKGLGLPIFVFDNRSILKKYDMSKYLIVQYGSANPSDLADILCWFQKKMMDDERFALDLLDSINNFKQKISEEQIESPKTDLFAVLLGVSGMILKHSGFSEEETDKAVDNRLRSWLNSASSDSSLITSEFCNYIKNCDLPLKDAHDYDPVTDDEKTLYLNKDNLCITMPVFKKAASNLNTDKNLLAKQLKEDDFLETQKDNFQKYVSTKSGSHNFYVIPLSKLYAFGEVQMHISEFTDNQPYKKIPFGSNGENQIYFCVNKNDHSENCHMYVSGVSGSGKSYAVKKFAVEAHRQGIEVLNIGASGSTLDFDDADYVNLSDVSSGGKAALNDVFNAVKQENLSEQCRSLLNILEESVEDTTVAADLNKWENDYFPMLDNEEGKDDLVEAVRTLYCSGKLNWQRWCSSEKITVLEADDNDTVDRLLTELIDFKSKQKSQNKCMLIVDECQELDLNQKSPLVKLLKQGRKYGIIVVLISQFLTAEDGKNIEDTLKQCETKVIFKPGADKKSARYIDYDLKDSDVYDAVCGIGNYQCIVKGKFCTDTFKVDYPLILKIPE